MPTCAPHPSTSWSPSHRPPPRSLCGDFELTFSGGIQRSGPLGPTGEDDGPTEFTVRRTGGRGRASGDLAGALDAKYRSKDEVPEGWDAKHPAVQRVLGKGPWAWAGITPLAFLGWGALYTPWGRGTYVPVAGTDDTLIVTFIGTRHRVVVSECYAFKSTRDKDGDKVDGWVQLGNAARGCPF